MLKIRICYRIKQQLCFVVIMHRCHHVYCICATCDWLFATKLMCVLPDPPTIVLNAYVPVTHGDDAMIDALTPKLGEAELTDQSV